MLRRTAGRDGDQRRHAPANSLQGREKIFSRSQEKNLSTSNREKYASGRTTRSSCGPTTSCQTAHCPSCEQESTIFGMLSPAHDASCCARSHVFKLHKSSVFRSTDIGRGYVAKSKGLILKIQKTVEVIQVQFATGACDSECRRP